jgi:hypothetical protein
MHSHDGLASGYDTPENICVLENILFEYGMNEAEAEEAIGAVSKDDDAAKTFGDDRDYIFRVNKKGARNELDYYISVGHPNQKKYPNKERYNGPRKYTDPKKYRVATKKNVNNALAKSEKDPFFKMLKSEKNISIDNVARIKNIFKSHSEDVEVTLFKQVANKIESIEEAIKIYEGEKYSLLQGLINKMDDTKFSSAGRGEMPFVILLKGAKSGGASAGADILFAEKVVEVKEAQSKGIKISAPTLEGYTRTQFNIAVHELALLATGGDSEKILEFLIKVLTDKGGPDSPYKVVSNSKEEKQKTAIEKFFDDPKVGELTHFLLDGLFIISEKIRDKSEKVNKPKATIDVDIGGQKHKEFKVPDRAIPDLSSQLSGISQGSVPSVLTVPVAQTQEDSDEYIENKVMKLSFFRENWTRERVQKEIVTDLVAKQYKNLLIVEKSPKNAASLYGSETINRLRFYGVGFAKIHLLLPGEAEPDELTDEA